MTRGDLVTLRSGSDFTPAVDSCLENDDADTQATDVATPAVAGDAFFYLVRAEAACKTGTYDSAGTGQAAGRDGEIDASASSCP